MGDARELVHATAIAIRGCAALIRGPSGAGKSDLALRCLALARSPLLTETARLVADDQVMLVLEGSSIRLEAPATIRGKIEVRGLGVTEVEPADSAILALVADLVPPNAYERMPEDERFTRVLGLPVPCVEIAPFEASAPLKLLLALERAANARPRQGPTG